MKTNERLRESTRTLLRAIKNARQTCTNRLLALATCSVGIIFFCEAVAGDESNPLPAREQLAFMRLALSAALGASILGFLAAKLWPRLRAISAKRRTEPVGDLPSCQTIKRMFDRLRAEMCIQDSIELRIDRRASHGLPSVIKLGVAWIVVMPLGMLRIAREFPEGAYAMLAHELAHVRHDDADLYLIPTLFARVLNWIVLPSALAILALQISYGGDAMLISLFIGAAVVFMAVLARSALGPLAESRYLSELLADTVAVMHSDGHALLCCVTALSTPPRHLRHVHPPPEDRAANIRGCLAILNGVTSDSLNDTLLTVGRHTRSRKPDTLVVGTGWNSTGRYRAPKSWFPAN